MKVTFFSEDTPDGENKDWPVVPRVGEIVHFHYRGGTNILAVQSVVYNANADGELDYVGVDLVYPQRGTYLLQEL